MNRSNSEFFPFFKTVEVINFFPTLYPEVCESNKLSCDDGAKCLPLTWVCDSINDCNDNKDEHNCPNRRTGKDVFTLQ